MNKKFVVGSRSEYIHGREEMSFDGCSLVDEEDERRLVIMGRLVYGFYGDVVAKKRKSDGEEIDEVCVRRN